MSNLDTKQYRGLTIHLLEALFTPEGPARTFTNLGHGEYLAKQQDREWTVSLDDLQVLNPTKYLEEGPSTRERCDQEAFVKRTHLIQHRPAPIRQRRRDDWEDWFIRQQRQANRAEAALSDAWARIRQRCEPPLTTARSEHSEQLPLGAEVAERLRRSMTLDREARVRENAETPFWMRPSRDD